MQNLQWQSVSARLTHWKMRYYEVNCLLEPFSEVAADLLSAQLAEIGFESFSQTEDCLLAYIQQSEWDEAKMRQVIQDFPLPDVSIGYVCNEAPDEDWNQVWEGGRVSANHNTYSLPRQTHPQPPPC